MPTRVGAHQIPQFVQQYPMVLVTFTSKTCGPCHAMGPVLREFEARSGVPVLQVDAMENMYASQAYDIRQVPTSLMFSDGQLVGRHEGFAQVPLLMQLAQ